MKIKAVALWLSAGALEAQAKIEIPALVLTGMCEPGQIIPAL